jgi:uncharacterized protein (TIGR00251 family)
MLKLTTTADSITFAVRVQPRASQSGIAGEMDGALKLRVAAPPVEGAANEELIRWLAKFFDVPRALVTIISGETAKQKIVRVSGVTPSDAKQKLLAAVSP